MRTRSLVALMLLAATLGAQARVVELQAHNLRSAASSGNSPSTLSWKTCAGPTYAAPCVNPTNPWVVANGITGSTATWDWDPVAHVLTGTGRYETATYLSSNTAGSSILADKVSDLVINAVTQSTTASAFECIEGTFVPTVGSSACGNFSLGGNGVIESSIAYNVGGDATCQQRTLGGDDYSLGGQQRGLTARAAGGGCDDTAGAFSLWTVVRDDGVPGGTLILSNGLCQTCPNVSYMTFLYVDGPYAGADSATTSRNTPVTVDVLANDGGFADPVTVSVTAAPANGSVTVTGSPGAKSAIVVTYTPPAGFRGTDSFQYSISDSVNSATAMVSISVGLAPSYYPLGAQTGVPVSTVTGGGWKQCYVSFMGSSIGSNAENVLSACSGDHLMMGGRETGSDTLLVLAAAPFSEAIKNTGQTSATHVANGASWYFAPNWAWGFTSIGDDVTLNSCDTSSGPTSMCLHTSGGGGYRINNLFNLFGFDYEKIFFVSQAPGAYPDTAVTYRSKPVDINVMSNDVGFADPSTVDVTVIPQNGGVVVSNSPGNPALVYVTYTPNAGFEGTDTFTYSAGDGSESGSAVVTVEVRAPQAAADSAQVRKGTAKTIDVLANDTGFSDPVSVSIAAGPQNGVAVVSGSPGAAAGVLISYTPNADFIGIDSFQYLVSDGVNSATGTVTVDVTEFEAVDDTYVLVATSGQFLYVGQNDIGFPGTVTLSVISGPDRGSWYVYGSPGSANNVSVLYYPEYGSNYTTSLTYQLTDGARSDTATVQIEVVQFLARDDEATAGATTPVVIDVTQNDVGFNYPRVVGIYRNPQHGRAVPNNGDSGCCYQPTITYTAEPGFVGDDTFQYAIDDGTRIGIATVTVHVIPDADRDGWSDGTDNCVNVANADQRDADGDGYGSMCDADFNNDGRVNFADLAMFRASFGMNDPNVDMDGTGVVNFPDLARFKSLFGKVPGPSGQHP